LIVVTVVAVLAASFLQLSSAVTRRQQRATDTKEAFYLAEAGLTEAYTGLRLGKTGNVGTEKEPARFGSGMFWVEATEITDGVIELASCGLSGSGRALLSVVVEEGDVNHARLGIFAQESIEIPAGTVIDGYDSRIGSYEEQTGGDSRGRGRSRGGRDRGSDRDDLALARLGSNGDIVVHSSRRAPTVINGDVHPGPGGMVIADAGAVISGSTEPSQEQTGFTDVEVPEVELQDGIDLSNGLTLVLAPGEQGYEHLNVDSASEVLVHGPCSLVVGGLRLAGGSALTFDTSGGPIDVYVTAHLVLLAGTQVGTSNDDPSEITLYVSEESEVELAADAAFHGTIYAPRSTVAVSSDFELFGALVANELKLAPGVNLHFDQKLVALAVEEGMPGQMSWRIVDFAPLEAGSIDIDPFRFFGLDPDALSPPASSHEDQNLQIRYVGHDGSTHDFEGMESDFDWASVAFVLIAYRDGELVIPIEDLATYWGTTGGASSQGNR